MAGEQSWPYNLLYRLKFASEGLVGGFCYCSFPPATMEAGNQLLADHTAAAQRLVLNLSARGWERKKIHKNTAPRNFLELPPVTFLENVKSERAWEYSSWKIFGNIHGERVGADPRLNVLKLYPPLWKRLTRTFSGRVLHVWRAALCVATGRREVSLLLLLTWEWISGAVVNSLTTPPLSIWYSLPVCLCLACHLNIDELFEPLTETYDPSNAVHCYPLAPVFTLPHLLFYFPHKQLPVESSASFPTLLMALPAL